MPKAMREFYVRVVLTLLPLLLGLVLFFYMWMPDSIINPLTWVMFHDTYLVYSVAGAIAVTAIAVTVVGTVIYIVSLFGSMSANNAPQRPLLFALLVLLAATLCMFAPVWMGYFAAFSGSTAVSSAEAIRLMSWFFLVTFVLFLIADVCTLHIYRTLNDRKPENGELKFEVSYAIDSILFIDIPVIISITAGLILEHFVGSNGHLMAPVEGRPERDVQLAMEGMLLGLSLGGIALHVMMSQVIFLLLNFRCAWEKYRLSQVV